jgi:hypothetical protein
VCVVAACACVHPRVLLSQERTSQTHTHTHTHTHTRRAGCEATVEAGVRVLRLLCQERLGRAHMLAEPRSLQHLVEAVRGMPGRWECVGVWGGARANE